MNWLKDLFALGYGKPEFQQDLKAAVLAMAAWAAIRIPQIKSFTIEEFEGDLKIVLALGVAKFLSSYVTNNTPPGGPKPPPDLGA